MFGRRRRAEEQAVADVTATLTTMAQAARALDVAYGDTGQVTEFIGAMVLGLAARMGGPLGDPAQVSQLEQLLCAEMGLDEAPAHTKLYIAMPDLRIRAQQVRADVYALGRSDQDSTLETSTRKLAHFYGFDATSEDIPDKVGVICQHAALTMTTTRRDTRTAKERQRFLRLELAAELEAQLLAMWRLNELTLLQMGKTPGYVVRPEPSKTEFTK